MKKQSKLFLFAAGFCLILILAVSSGLSAQPKWQPVQLTGFPDQVAPILANSCAGCHSDQSKGKAKDFLNLSSFSTRTPKAQAKEAKAIAKQVSKGSMPPAGFLEKVPQAKLNAEQIAALSSWAKELKKKK